MQASTTVSVRALSSRKQGPISIAISASLAGSASELRLSESREVLRADQRDLTIAGIVADQRARIFTRDRCLRAEHRDAPGDRAGAGRLDRRHRADERDRE